MFIIYIYIYVCVCVMSRILKVATSRILKNVIMLFLYEYAYKEKKTDLCLRIHILRK